MMESHNVLVIIDVQNCFMIGGSLGAESFTLIDELNSLMELKNNGKKYFNTIVVTKDTHPSEHASFNTYPIHCRPKPLEDGKQRHHSFKKCDIKKISTHSNIASNDFGKNVLTLENLLDPEFENLNNLNDEVLLTIKKIKQYIAEKNISEELLKRSSFYNENIYGHDLSYLYKIVHLAETQDPHDIPHIFNPDMILTANSNTNNTDANFDAPSRDNLNKIVKFKNNDEYVEIGNWNEKYCNEIEKLRNNPNDQIIIEMEKGMICDMDANSAFVYHVDYSKPSEMEIETKKELSTGLLELLLDLIPNDGININIYLCGLVGNICVIQSALHGAALFKLLGINRSVKFHYMSGYGTRFLSFSSLNKSQINENEAKEYLAKRLDEINKLNGYMINELVDCIHLIYPNQLLINANQLLQNGGYKSELYKKYLKYKSKYLLFKKHMNSQ